MNVSNTLLNAYRDYKKMNACGKEITEVYVNKSTIFETSETQQAGQWFEYKATGEALRDGIIPEPVKTKSGLAAAITKHLTGQYDNFKRIYKNLEITHTGEVLEYEENGINYKGILDVVAESEEIGRHIRDIKTTGLIDNIWEATGWGMLMGDEYKPKKKHLNQAIIYTCLWYKLTGEIIPFYFDVFSNKNPNDCKIVKIVIDEHEIDIHWGDIVKLSTELSEELKKGLTPRPDMKRCRKCPVIECEHRTDLPEIETVYL